MSAAFLLTGEGRMGEAIAMLGEVAEDLTPTKTRTRRWSSRPRCWRWP